MEMGRPSKATYDMAQGVSLRNMLGSNIAPLLELADHVTVSRQKIHIDMVPCTPSGPAAPPPT